MLSLRQSRGGSHSQFDVRISEFFYNNGQWLIEKGEQPYAFIFYDGPKALLILLALYLISVLVIKYRQSSNIASIIDNNKTSKFIVPFSIREISYLLTPLSTSKVIEKRRAPH